jgi:RNA polymerase sigma-70 factor (ECF subfamily)
VDREPVDIQAFAVLYRDHLTPVYHYCARRLPTLEDAEDATSQIFTKALATLATQREPSSLRSWLFTIAHNVIADHYRARHLTVALTDVAAEPSADAARPEAEVLDRDMVRSLLARLPGEQARIVELRLAGLTREEIARVLGKNPNAIKVAQFRAYARLRELVAAADDTPTAPVHGETA